MEGAEMENLRLTILGHCVLVGPMLYFVYVQLRQRGLIGLHTVGSWVLLSAAAYFVMYPLAAVVFSPSGFFMSRTRLTEGAERLGWISLVTLLGLGAFYWTYLSATPIRNIVALPRGLPQDWLFPIGLCVLAGFFFAVYYGGAFGVRPVAAEFGHVAVGASSGGIHTGMQTGYQYAGYRLLLFPIVFLLWFRQTRGFGLTVLVLFVVGRLFVGGDRAATLTPVVAGVILFRHQNPDKPFPRSWLIAAVLLLAVLVARGHSGINRVGADELADKTASAHETLALGGDAGFLPNLYLLSRVVDKSGYDFGLPVVRTALFGWIPTSIFPEKWSVFSDLLPNYELSRSEYNAMQGNKTTVIGTAYRAGGVVGVVIILAGLGVIGRKVDGLLDRRQPEMVQAYGVMFLSTIWIVSASDLEWTIQWVGYASAPYLLMLMMIKRPARQPLLPDPQPPIKPRTA
jgi:oligosaccharide repeat unit polymerase